MWFVTESWESTAVSFAMPVCPHVTKLERLNGFLRNWMMINFTEMYDHIPFFLIGHFIQRTTCRFA